MENGISGKPCPDGLPYARLINSIAFAANFFPCLVGAIKMNETGLGFGPTTETNVSGDGGHGIMQLTSSYPDDWEDPTANISYAVQHFMVPAYEQWRGMVQGDDLVRCIAATYNAGYGNAFAGHAEGNVDKYTTNEYAQRALAHYQKLVDGIVTYA